VRNQTAFRRSLLKYLAGALASVATLRPARSETSGIVAGAIRWDAWYRRTDASLYAQANLGSKKFQSRAPAHCTKVSDEEIECVGTQAAMDNEIAFAAKAGIKFWAFVWYGPESSLRVAWDLYQSSRIRNRVNWCGVVTPAGLGSAPFENGQWRQKIEQWASYMASDSYQKITVDGIRNRPILFLLWHDREIKDFFGGDYGNIGMALKLLGQKASAVGLGRPYIVVLDGVKGANFVFEIGAQAISNYIAGLTSYSADSFEDLDRQTRVYWAALASTGKPIVPIAMVGWDPRARLEQPGPYHITGDPGRYFILPKPPELAEHIHAATRYINDNPKTCPSKLLLIYSWDECDEGGGLIPTIGDPAGLYLSALAPILN
jgi:hypothetical protein